LTLAINTERTQQGSHSALHVKFALVQSCTFP